MALGISKATPKYTPPKVCKKVKKVISPPWGKVDCPTVQRLTAIVTWPAEQFALNHDVRLIYILEKTAPCTWTKNDGYVPGAHGFAALFVQFRPFGPELEVEIGYQWDPGHNFNYSHLFADYNAHQTKLLVPVGIEPDASGEAENIAILFLTT
jgi:hypothetical protein